ncbi:unnamed protein product [Rotaria sordida]|uniref:Uncharacterized protein n=1 Tax=Rotaria sordida TaxID=392033 RepID=A0A819QTR3_9BILA|nr:unnamed protein product [Rotaria sordida]
MELNKNDDIEISDDSPSETEAAATETVETHSSYSNKLITNTKNEKRNSTSKRRCTFNQNWLNDSKYAPFLKECRTNKHLAHCSVCKSNFSIANGGTYLINRHMEQDNHKRLAETQEKENSRSIRDFIVPSSALTKLTAAELSLVYHGVRHGYSYISQSCTFDLLKKIFGESYIGQNICCGKTKARELSVNVLVVEQPFESAEAIVKTIHHVLKKHNLNIEKLTSIGADNINTNYGRYHSVFSIMKLEILNLFKGNCFCHILSNSVKTSHHYLPVDVESYLSQLYSHFSSSSKRVAELKEYFEFVEEDYLRLLQHIKIRWLSLYNSIDRLLKVYDPLSSYFFENDKENEDQTTYPQIIINFFSSTVSKCTLHFLHQVLFDIQLKNLELQQYSTSFADLHRIITSLLKKLNDRLEQKYFGHHTRSILNSMSKDDQEKTISSFTQYLSNVIKYINKYYEEHSLLAETLSIFGIIEIDQIKFDQIERCVNILKLELDHDQLFEEMINLQTTFKKVTSYREPLYVQIQKHVGNNNFIFDDTEETHEEETHEEETLIHKTTTSNDEYNHPKIRPDQLWAYLISKTTPNCQEIIKLLSFVYSIPCSNAFTEGVFNHMKLAWTPSRNSMNVETVAAELQIRLNCKLKCYDFFSFVQTESDLIKCARGTQKYSFKKKACST